MRVIVGDLTFLFKRHGFSRLGQISCRGFSALLPTGCSLVRVPGNPGTGLAERAALY